MVVSDVDVGDLKDLMLRNCSNSYNFQTKISISSTRSFPKYFPF